MTREEIVKAWDESPIDESAIRFAFKMVQRQRAEDTEEFAKLLEELVGKIYTDESASWDFEDVLLHAANAIREAKP